MKQLLFSFALFYASLAISLAQALVSDSLEIKNCVHLASNFAKSKKPDSVLFYTEKGLKLLENSSYRNTTWKTALMNHRAGALLNQELYKESKEIWEQVLVISKNDQPRSLDFEAGIWSNLALANKNLGDDEATLLCYQEALQLRQNSSKDKYSMHITDLQYAISSHCRKMGLNAKSLQYSISLLDYLDNPAFAGKVDSVDRLKAYVGLVNSYAALKEFDKALDVGIKTYDEYKMGTYANSVHFSTLLTTLGIIEKSKDNPKKAIFYYDKAIAIFNKMQPSGSLNTAKILSNVGNLHRQIDNQEKAIELFSRALAMMLAQKGNNKLSLAQLHVNRAISYRLSQNFDEAKKDLQKAISYLTGVETVGSLEKLPDSSPASIYGWAEYLRALRESALLWYDLNDKTLCYTFFDFYKKEADRCRKLLDREEDKLFLLGQNQETYAKFLQACFSFNAKENVDRAFRFSEASKAVLLQDAMNMREAKKSFGIPSQVLKIEDSLLELRAKLELEVLQLAAEAPELPKKRTEFFLLHTKIDAFQDSIKKGYPKLFSFEAETNANLSLKVLQKSLDAETCVLSYAFADTSLFVLLISKKTSSFLKLGNAAQAEKLASQLRTAIYLKSKAFYTQVAQECFRMLMPKEALAFKQLLIVPDGVLHKLPFETFLTEKPQSPEYKDYPFLVKTKQISYAASCELWVEQQQKKYHSKGLLAIAPVFAGNKLDQTIQSLDSLPYERTVSQVVLTPLPGTAIEVKAIDKIVKENKMASKILLQEEATEENLKKELDFGYRYVHIATHGFVNEHQNALSGVVLSKGASQKEDGTLYVNEILGLELKTELLVLSACETGLGKVKNGEGVMGLSRALTFAGAKNLILSLWKVDDSSTNLLMQGIYEHLYKKKSIAQSLQEAKCKLIETGEFAAPYYWSSFVLLGK